MQPTLFYDHFFVDRGSANRLGLSGKLGYQWVIANRALLSLSGGVSYNAQFTRGVIDSSWLDSAAHSRGFVPDASFSVGVGF